MKIEQQGFALIQSIIATAVFAILLIALLNYTQYIVLNFNQLYKDSTAVRVLHSRLEKQGAVGDETYSEEISSIGAVLRYPEWKIEQTLTHPVKYCTESMASLLISRQRFSLSRWYCSIGEHYVSGLSF
ncbi:hypothetical protein VCB84_003648 [Providencia rettgeri]|uniref:type IV pilus modification PilV family protein n=1 Tax=Providencia TaxID=586 RepID=UPI001C22466B|nr:prepilin-type N-terminal cleavage/methylation domain-containing protein [Providencia rettgeri]EJD6500816.1 hypothetical protein [Providencia rettgeri]EJD6642234.1 hypothetical protein [Providencia rettgeri]ELL9152727.1 hypothetical protein [Providencia rettgeri]ELR5050213.1 hypothetical protein [Providencia rettgeri]ELR5063221.1 hypothetical protein [Providencia rettgeri]